MASTKRKRRTKHRGNAAGFVESRGRTGRKPTPAEAKSQAKRDRASRFSRQPSWRSALNRSAIAASIFVLVSIFLLHTRPVVGIVFGLFLTIFYTPVGYYTDTFVYRRRQARLAKQGQGQGKR
ncbi:MAG: hypothetical protein QOC78_199 [Solirubrobacteraceae bacterium]|jgi:hypothetical protein|nr:hypothetical protein [Solirubrobacteraceae bacterium]MEA2275239.1 hypothetical protein [Solirubrobacteraceae bacterium]MEA2394342.1 hypothetical protein [Solirubrobacteraceae bacterium]